MILQWEMTGGTKSAGCAGTCSATRDLLEVGVMNVIAWLSCGLGAA